jgi:hypothetical protein
MIPFPTSLLLLPLAAALGVVYVTAGGWLRAPAARAALRTALLGTTWTLPLLVPGPGPAKLVVGLLVGFWGIRMVALAERHRRQGRGPEPGRRARSALWLFVEMVTPDDFFTPAGPPGEAGGARGARPLRTAALGLILLGGCIGLIWLGSGWQLWRRASLADDLLVLVEVAIGAAGVHRLIVGLGEAIAGYPIAGLQKHPLRATSLSEFWSRRWNRLVQRNLERAFFRRVLRPLHRRDRRSRGTGRGADRGAGRARPPLAGVLAAFGASGIMHVVAVADLSDLRATALPSAAVLVFFLLHGALVSLERTLGLGQPPETLAARRWARLRTLALFALLSPLLLDPFARVTGVHGRSLSGPCQAGRAPEARAP